MSSIVIYYSKTGSTKCAAEFIAREKKAEICPIIESKSRKGLFGFLGGAREAIKGIQSDIESDAANAIQQKDKIYIGTPIWAGNGTPAVNSLIDMSDFNGKKVVLFTMQADPQFEGSRLVAESLTEKIRLKGGEVIQSLAFHGNSPRKEPDFQDIEKQIKGAEIL